MKHFWRGIAYVMLSLFQHLPPFHRCPFPTDDMLYTTPILFFLPYAHLVPLDRPADQTETAQNQLISPTTVFLHCKTNTVMLVCRSVPQHQGNHIWTSPALQQWQMFCRAKYLTAPTVCWIKCPIILKIQHCMPNIWTLSTLTCTTGSKNKQFIPKPCWKISWFWRCPHYKWHQYDWIAPHSRVNWICLIILYLTQTKPLTC